MRALALALSFAGFAAAASAGDHPSLFSGDAAATVVLVTGSVHAGPADGQRHALGSGDAVYSGDTIFVGPNSYANLRFRDGGRILLRPDTEFTVEDFQYRGGEDASPSAVPSLSPTPDEDVQAAAASQPAAAPRASGLGRAFFHLARGGFRALSGILGKAEPRDYRVSTPVATVGIRGTDYEVLLCESDCPVSTRDAAPAASGKAAAPAPQQGAIVSVHSGSIAVKGARGTFQVDAGQFMVAMGDGQTYVLPAPPDALLLNPTPSPNACQ